MSQATRRSILAKRRALSPEDRAEASAEILDRLRSAWAREAVPEGLDIGLYRSMPEEVDLGPVAHWLEAEGHRLYFPRVVDLDQGLLEWACARVSVPDHWTPGRFGILEPCGDLSGSARPGLDVIFVPGVAFGEAGERVGMGMGFYDRVLAHLAGAIRIALAYDFQILPSLEQNAWDQRVHWIFSERREIQACRVQDRVGQLSR